MLDSTVVTFLFPFFFFSYFGGEGCLRDFLNGVILLFDYSDSQGERLRLRLDVEGTRRVDVFPMDSLQRDNGKPMQSG